MTARGRLQEIVYKDGSRSIWLLVRQMKFHLERADKAEIDRIDKILGLHGEDVTGEFLTKKIRSKTA